MKRALWAVALVAIVAAAGVVGYLGGQADSEDDPNDVTTTTSMPPPAAGRSVEELVDEIGAEAEALRAELTDTQVVWCALHPDDVMLAATVLGLLPDSVLSTPHQVRGDDDTVRGALRILWGAHISGLALTDDVRSRALEGALTGWKVWTGSELRLGSFTEIPGNSDQARACRAAKGDPEYPSEQ